MIIAKYHDATCCITIGNDSVGIEDHDTIFLNRIRQENTIKNMKRVVRKYMREHNIPGLVVDFTELEEVKTKEGVTWLN